MLGPFNQYIGSDIAEAKARREQRGRSPCVYYRSGLCVSRPQPQCPHYSMGLCVGAGNCSDFTRHYQMPAQLVREQAGLF